MSGNKNYNSRVNSSVSISNRHNLLFIGEQYSREEILLSLDNHLPQKDILFSARTTGHFKLSDGVDSIVIIPATGITPTIDYPAYGGDNNLVENFYSLKEENIIDPLLTSRMKDMGVDVSNNSRVSANLTLTRKDAESDYSFESDAHVFTPGTQSVQTVSVTKLNNSFLAQTVREGYIVKVAKINGHIFSTTHTGHNINSQWGNIRPHVILRDMLLKNGIISGASPIPSKDSETNRTDATKISTIMHDANGNLFDVDCQTCRFCYQFSIISAYNTTNSRNDSIPKYPVVLFQGIIPIWEYGNPPELVKDILGKDQQFPFPNEKLFKEKFNAIGGIGNINTKTGLVRLKKIKFNVRLMIPLCLCSIYGTNIDPYSTRIPLDGESLENTNPNFLPGESIRLTNQDAYNSSSEVKFLKDNNISYVDVVLAPSYDDLFIDTSITLQGPGVNIRSLLRSSEFNNTIVVYTALNSPAFVQDNLMISDGLYRDIRQKLSSSPKGYVLLPHYDNGNALTVDELIDGDGPTYVEYVATVVVFLMPAHQQQFLFEEYGSINGFIDSINRNIDNLIRDVHYNIRQLKADKRQRRSRNTRNRFDKSHDGQFLKMLVEADKITDRKSAIAILARMKEFRFLYKNYNAKDNYESAKRQVNYARANADNIINTIGNQFIDVDGNTIYNNEPTTRPQKLITVGMLHSELLSQLGEEAIPIVNTDVEKRLEPHQPYLNKIDWADMVDDYYEYEDTM